MYDGQKPKRYFNSRPLYRGRHCRTGEMPVMRGISTHAPYTEGDLVNHVDLASLAISTHAPYTEGDSVKNIPFAVFATFQLTPPIQRATVMGMSIRSHVISFQLTPPIQRATKFNRNLPNNLSISTHAPYTEGDYLANPKSHDVNISTHAPYTEGDGKKQAI